MNGLCIFEGDDANEFFLKLALHSFEEGYVENDSQDSVGSHDETGGAFVRRLFGDVDAKSASASFFPRLVFGHCVEFGADAVNALLVFLAGFGCSARESMRFRRMSTELAMEEEKMSNNDNLLSASVASSKGLVLVSEAAEASWSSLRSFCSKVALSSLDSGLSLGFSDAAGDWAFGLASGLAPAKAPKPNDEPLTIGFEGAAAEVDAAPEGEAEPFSAL